jgi:hypothetical protein
MRFGSSTDAALRIDFRIGLESMFVIRLLGEGLHKWSTPVLWISRG